MYFLSNEERKYVLRRLLPQARKDGAHEDLRGWNWMQPPLLPIYDVRLALYEIAGRYCHSRRDVYLRRVQGIKTDPNRAMIEGRVLHNVIAEFILATKRAIYVSGKKCLDALAEIRTPNENFIWGSGITDEIRESLTEKVAILWDFEYHRVVARVQEVLATQPYASPDSIVALAVPVAVEQRLDGRFLGLSSHLAADAFALSEPMMMDIKFGKPRNFHKLTATGYALVMESIYEFPINVGCIVYPGFRDGHIVLKRDFYMIGDELRQWFIDERDELQRLVDEEIDPGVTADCEVNCPYWPHCHP